MSASVCLAKTMASSARAMPQELEKSRKLRRYTAQEKLEAVRRVLAAGGRELHTHVADSIGVPESTLRGWLTAWKRERRLPGFGRVTDEENEAAPVASPTEEKKGELEPPKVIGYVVACQVVWLAPSAAEETPEVKKNEVSPPTSPETEAAREAKGRQRTSSSSSSARKERTSKKVCSVKDAAKRKRQDSGSDAEPQPKRAWCSRRLREAEERRRAEDLLNAPEEPCKYKTVLESVGLYKRPDAVDLPPLQ